MVLSPSQGIFRASVHPLVVKVVVKPFKLRYFITRKRRARWLDYSKEKLFGMSHFTVAPTTASLGRDRPVFDGYNESTGDNRRPARRRLKRVGSYFV
jgi:hypothetical protein